MKLPSFIKKLCKIFEEFYKHVEKYRLHMVERMKYAHIRLKVAGSEVVIMFMSIWIKFWATSTHFAYQFVYKSTENYNSVANEQKKFV